jgi:hypothetical protein
MCLSTSMHVSSDQKAKDIPRFSDYVNSVSCQKSQNFNVCVLGDLSKKSRAEKMNFGVAKTSKSHTAGQLVNEAIN